MKIKRSIQLLTIGLGLLLAFGLGISGSQAAPPAVTESCQVWDLAADFRVSPDQENPNRDSCGNPDVWHFMEGADLSRDPTTFSLLSNFATSSSGIPGLEKWTGSGGWYPAPDGLPEFLINTTGVTQDVGYPLPPNVIEAHPDTQRQAIAGWRSPVTGGVTISGLVTDLNSGCGDGILWYVDKGAANLASGSIVNGGSQAFQDGAGGGSLAQVAVTQGDFIYLGILPGGDSYCDGTQVDLTISLLQGIYLSPSIQSASGAPGDTVAYTIELVNYTGAEDSFDLTLGDHAWPTNTSVSTLGPIAAGGSATFTVDVTVPADAGWYSTDAVTVFATSVANPAESGSATLTTEAYAPPQIAVSPAELSSTQTVGETTARSLAISNGNGVPLTFDVTIGGRTSFLAVSKELYGYDVPDAWLRIIGTEDNTLVRVINLSDGSVIAQNADLDRYATWEVYPSDGTPYKVEADRPVLGYESDWDPTWAHTTFVPSLDSGPIGREFVFSYFRGSTRSAVYVFAMDDADVAVYDTAGSQVASRSLSAGQYWDLSLPNAVYRASSTGRIAIETVGTNGYTTVPASDGEGIGRVFLYATEGDYTGAFAVFAYEDAQVKVYDLDSGAQLYDQSIVAGAYWWLREVGTRRLRLESTGKVEVWAGDAEGCCGIEGLGDDISFAGGDGGREYYLHSLVGGSVIFVPFDNTDLTVDGVPYHLDKDQYLFLEGCCYFRHIQSSQPILIQTLGADNGWNDLGTYLGGVSASAGNSAGWLSADPTSGTVPTNGSVPVQVTFDATGVQPGSHTTNIYVSSNDPVTPSVLVPVTMLVEPTATMGWVQGTVADAATGVPLAATIRAEGQPYTVSTGADGAYKLWLEAGSYTLRASAADHDDQTAVVDIAPGSATVQDFAMPRTIPPPVPSFGFWPGAPTIVDTIQFYNNSWDPDGAGIQTTAWDFGDGASASNWNPTHQYAVDGDYTVNLTVTTYDGRTASTAQTIHVETHDVGIVKIAAPQTARAGQTRPIVVGIKNARYPEEVRVELYKGTPSGSQWISDTVRTIPVRLGGRTTSVSFNYTFTAEDARMRKVTFRAIATILGHPDVWPADNEAISTPTKVTR